MHGHSGITDEELMETNQRAGKCRICGQEFYPFIDFGSMPIANAFLSKAELKNEYFYDLAAAFCPKCSMVQLVEQPARERMFHQGYPFFTGSSLRMIRHFEALADRVLSEYCQKENPFVVEIGSNDGTFLGKFSKCGMRHLGIEPSKNVAQTARTNGVRSRVDFFDEKIGREIAASEGLADAVVAANCMCHIPYLESVLKGVRALLKEEGVFVFEDPYLGDVLEKGSYDQIYDEHVYLFSVTAIQTLAERCGLEIFDLEHLDTHGGSMRFYLTHPGRKEINPCVGAWMQKEKHETKITEQETYDLFRQRCERSKEDLSGLLQRLQEEGKTVMGYAATSKSTTVIQYCKITQSQISAIADTTPFKQKKLSPGAHIPIVSTALFKNRPPDYAVLFGWNHQAEIMVKEEGFIQNGGRWIVYVPRVEILGSNR